MKGSAFSQAMQLTFKLEAENNALRARIAELEQQLTAHHWAPVYKDIPTDPAARTEVYCRRCRRVEPLRLVLDVPDDCTGGK